MEIGDITSAKLWDTIKDVIRTQIQDGLHELEKVWKEEAPEGNAIKVAVGIKLYPQADRKIGADVQVSFSKGKFTIKDGFLFDESQLPLFD